MGDVVDEGGLEHAQCMAFELCSRLPEEEETPITRARMVSGSRKAGAAGPNGTTWLGQFRLDRAITNGRPRSNEKFRLVQTVMGSGPLIVNRTVCMRRCI